MYNMAWLQSSFTNHTLLGDSSSNQKKNFKSGAVTKNFDPDKSYTPLLHGSSNSPDAETPSLECQNIPSIAVEKKKNMPSGSTKSSFLSHGFFDKSSGSSKNKVQGSQKSFNASNSSEKTQAESKSLLSDSDKKHPLFQDDDEVDEDEDSDDEWCIPQLGGYRKVGPCAE